MPTIRTFLRTIKKLTMKLITISTGSKGNAYFLKPKKGKGLILECGVTFRALKEGLNFDLWNVAGCVVSHEHKDHAKCAKEFINSGIPVYMSFGTAKATKVNNPTCLIAGDVIQIGDFRIVAFDVEHDAVEPFGFVIQHVEMGTMLFATDTKSLNYTFQNINHWMIEANFSEKLMLEGLEQNKINGYLANRVYDNHMSIEKCIEVLEAQNLDETHSITLIHISASNGDGKLFENMVSRAVGIKPHIAQNGLIIEL